MLWENQCRSNDSVGMSLLKWETTFHGGGGRTEQKVYGTMHDCGVILLTDSESVTFRHFRSQWKMFVC